MSYEETHDTTCTCTGNKRRVTLTFAHTSKIEHGSTRTKPSRRNQAHSANGRGLPTGTGAAGPLTQSTQGTSARRVGGSSRSRGRRCARCGLRDRNEPLGRRRRACGDGGAARAGGFRAQVCGGLGRGCGRRLVTGDAAARARAARGGRPEVAAHELCVSRDVWARVPTRVHRRRGRWRRRAARQAGARAACRSRRRRAALCSTRVVRAGCAPG